MVRSIGVHTKIYHMPQRVIACNSRLKHLGLVVCLRYFSFVAGHIIHIAVLSPSLSCIVFSHQNVLIVANASHVVLMVVIKVVLNQCCHITECSKTYQARIYILNLEEWVVTAITGKVAFVMARFTELINVREALWTLSTLTRL